MAKLYASEVAVYVADEAVQIFGGYGYIKDFPAEESTTAMPNYARSGRNLRNSKNGDFKSNSKVVLA